jgi:hypothetical protein
LVLASSSFKFKSFARWTHFSSSCLISLANWSPRHFVSSSIAPCDIHPYFASSSCFRIRTSFLMISFVFCRKTLTGANISCRSDHPTNFALFFIFFPTSKPILPP